MVAPATVSSGTNSYVEPLLQRPRQVQPKKERTIHHQKPLQEKRLRMSPRRPQEPSPEPPPPDDQEETDNQTQENPPWIQAYLDRILGDQDVPSTHLAYYSKTQYECDSELILHYSHEWKRYQHFPFFKYIDSKPIYWTARGILSTASDAKVQGFTKKKQPYRLGGEKFQWLTSLPGFEMWAKRYRFGPTNRRANTETPTEENEAALWVLGSSEVRCC